MVHKRRLILLLLSNENYNALFSDTLSKWKDKPQYGEKVLANQVSEQGTVSKIYFKKSKFNGKKMFKI